MTVREIVNKQQIDQLMEHVGFPGRGQQQSCSSGFELREWDSSLNHAVDVYCEKFSFGGKARIHLGSLQIDGYRTQGEVLTNCYLLYHYIYSLVIPIQGSWNATLDELGFEVQANQKELDSMHMAAPSDTN